MQNRPATISLDSCYKLHGFLLSREAFRDPEYAVINRGVREIVTESLLFCCVRENINIIIYLYYLNLL